MSCAQFSNLLPPIFSPLQPGRLSRCHPSLSANHTLARMLEYAKVHVLRRNHVGDWGTQFGMLIEYLFEMSPNGEVNAAQAIEDLEVFYKASKQRFDSDPAFKERAQQAVVSLQVYQVCKPLEEVGIQTMSLDLDAPLDHQIDRAATSLEEFAGGSFIAPSEQDGEGVFNSCSIPTKVVSPGACKLLCIIVPVDGLTAYEILLAAAGASGGLIVPSREKLALLKHKVGVQQGIIF